MKTNLMKRYKVPRISVVMYLLEHVEIVNLVNLEGETPLYCAILFRDDRKLFDLMCEKIHQRKLACRRQAGQGYSIDKKFESTPQPNFSE